MTVFWVLYIYCVLERLGELVVSRRNQAAMKAQGFSEKENTRGLRLMVVMHLGWYLGMLYEVIAAPSQVSSWAAQIALVLFLAAQVLRFWTLKTLGSFWNISVVTTDENAPRFVSEGPYRFIRHPNYLVVIIEIATLPLLGGAVWTALLFSALNGAVLVRRISLEESFLFQIPGYREAMGSKGRFFPRGTVREI